jgi:hypothetical protein
LPISPRAAKALAACGAERVIAVTTDDPAEAPRQRFPTQQVLRETLLYRATPEDLAVLLRLGDIMNLHLLEYPARGLTMRDALVAVAKDVRHLEGYLTEIAHRMTPEGMEGRSGQTLTVVARSLAGKLGGIAEWFEGELGVSAAQKRATLEPAEG